MEKAYNQLAIGFKPEAVVDAETNLGLSPTLFTPEKNMDNFISSFRFFCKLFKRLSLDVDSDFNKDVYRHLVHQVEGIKDTFVNVAEKHEAEALREKMAQVNNFQN
jgi:hypothetical protein